MRHNTNISIISIPTFRTKEELAPMLCDLEGTIRGMGLIVTSLPGSASDNRNAILESFRHGVELGHHRSGDIIVMIDDDVSGFYDGWVDDLIKPLLIYPNCMIASARLVKRDGSDAAMMFQGKQGEDYTTVQRVPTAAMAFRPVLDEYTGKDGTKRPIVKVGFDTGFKGSGFEDDWFMLCMQEEWPGGAIIVNNKCRLVHDNEEKNQHGAFYEHNKAHFEQLLAKYPETAKYRNRPAVPLRTLQYHSEHGQDKWLNENIFHNKTYGTFVEIGAIDGLLTSNSLVFERELDWSGLLVEANPAHKDAIVSNRSGCATAFVAVSDKKGKAKFLRCNRVTGWSGLEQSIEPQHLKRIIGRQEPVETVEVDTDTLDNILKQAGLKRIDYLSIDIEGAEYDALKDFPFDEYDIDVLDVENNYENDRVEKLLSKYGYKKIARLGVNDIYRR